MSRRFSVALVVSVLGMALSKAQAQPAPATQFPLAAPAGKDSGAINQAPAGAANQGPLDAAKWKYGSSLRRPAKFENLESGNDQNDEGREGDRWHSVQCGYARKRTAPWRMPATISSGQRCNTIHAIGTPSGRMWKACPHAKAVPGVRVAYTDEREIQHAMDLGALVIIVPTVRNVEEGIAARNWTMYPPLGKRSASRSRSR